MTAAGPFPVDQSPSRLAKFELGELDEKQRELYDLITSGPRAGGPQAFPLVDADGRLEGPFNAMLLSPLIGTALQQLGAAIRFGSQLTQRGREIAILLVAHDARSDFEVYAHEAVGAQVGLTAAEMAALRTADAGALPDTEQDLARVVLALIERGDLDDAEYAAAAARLGQPVIFELSAIVGYYSLLALQLRVFAVRAPSSPSEN